MMKLSVPFVWRRSDCSQESSVVRAAFTGFATLELGEGHDDGRASAKADTVHFIFDTAPDEASLFACCMHGSEFNRRLFHDRKLFR
jgi:hypothetical protein